jgi:hypothetical protein
VVGGMSSIVMILMSLMFMSLFFSKVECGQEGLKFIAKYFQMREMTKINYVNCYGLRAFRQLRKM